MTTAVEDRPLVTGPSEPPPPSKRRRWWLILLVLAVAAPAAFFYVRDRWATQPIGVGNGLLAFHVTGPRQDEVREFDTHATRPGEPSAVQEVPFQKGGHLRMAFGISNLGDRAIRVTGFDYGPDPESFETILDPAGVEVGPQCCGNILRHLRPFQPFTLEPGANPLIALNYDFVCQRASPNSSLIIDTFEIRYEALGSSRTVELGLPWRMVLRYPSKVDCPPGSAVFGS